MYRIIGGDGREYGPVTGDTIRQWVVQNRANAKTLVRPENSNDWRELGNMPEFGSSFGAPPPQPPPPPPPAVPGSAPAAPAVQPQTRATEDLERLAATLASRDYDIGFGECIGNAFKLLGRQFWPMVGGSFLVMLASFVLGAIPFFGFLSGLLLGQVFYSGLYFFYMKLARDEPANVGDAFSGFQRSFGHLVLVSLVMNLLFGILLIPSAGLVFCIFVWQFSPWILGTIAFLLSLPAVYFAVSWIFSGMLVIDRGFEFWDAMELSRKVASKHWFLVFLLSFVAGIIGSLGVFVFLIGVVFTIPITFATMVYAYERMFPRVGPNETPVKTAAPVTPVAPATPAEADAPDKSSGPASPEEPTDPADPASKP